MRYTVLSLLCISLTACNQTDDERFCAAVAEVRDELTSAIDVREIPISDESLLSRLRGLSSLKELNIDTSPITKTGLVSIGPLPDLKELSLSRTHITDVGCQTIAENFSGLVFLRIDETVVADQGVAALAGLEHLEELSLYRLHLTDRCCHTLASMKALKRVSLDGTMITDAGLKVLGISSSLERISIWDCKAISDKAIEQFQKDHPNIEINR